jgi:carbonic anhydrase
MDKILRGVRDFQRDVFPAQRGLFQRLARKQQKPQALFITCADSRINPNLLTQTEPGDLFLLRNAGNIIPPYGTAGGEGATIEYAVSVLGIRHIIVCGHWHCGAMKALLTAEELRDLPAVAAWFAHAEATRRVVRATCGHLTGEELHAAAAEQNVLLQLGHLRTHPCVAAGLARGDLQVHGWLYKLETGEIFVHDPGRGQFLALAEQAPPPVLTPAAPPVVPAS